MILKSNSISFTIKENLQEKVSSEAKFLGIQGLKNLSSFYVLTTELVLNDQLQAVGHLRRAVGVVRLVAHVRAAAGGQLRLHARRRQRSVRRRGRARQHARALAAHEGHAVPAAARRRGA